MTKKRKSKILWSAKIRKLRTRAVVTSLDKLFGKDKNPKVGWTNQVGF